MKTLVILGQSIGIGHSIKTNRIGIDLGMFGIKSSIPEKL